MPDQPVTHLEGLLDAAYGTLVANLDVAIAAVNAAHTDFQLDDVGTNIFLGGFTAPVYPMVEIAVPDWTLTQLSLGQQSSEKDFTLVVMVHAMDYETARLYRRLLRYVSAVLDVLLDQNALGGGVYIDHDRGVRGSYRYNPETGEQQQTYGTAALAFYLSTAEVNP